MTVTNFGANMMRPMPFTGYPFQGKTIQKQLNFFFAKNTSRGKKTESSIIFSSTQEKKITS